MNVYHFTLPWVVLDVDGEGLIRNRTDGVLVDRDGVESTATTALGVETRISTGPHGTTLPFVASIPAGRVRFGNVEAVVLSDEQADALELAREAHTLATAAKTTADAITLTASEVSYVVRDPDGYYRVVDDPVPLTSGGARLRRDPNTGDIYATTIV